METLTNYWIIAWSFIWENWNLIFAIIYWILMLYFQIKYYKEQRKNTILRTEKKDLEIKNLSYQIFTKVLVQMYWESKKEIDKLKNQKKTQKYYLEKRYLAFELATRFFLSKWAFNTLQRRYYLYNNKNLSTLEKIKKDLKKNK